jgi:NADH-quinone oxidoreductase subunit G
VAVEKVTVYIDKKPYKVKPNQSMLQACLSLGFDVPFFCWHPAMGSVGACRQCAVKLYMTEHDERGRLVMSCMWPAAEGTRISIQDPEAVAFRAGVIEGLMLNHPHDCPVCDEGGECHLQDMTVMTGHDYRQTRFPKRTFHNQYLGPFLNHEMNRCIQCYRCVRFYREYAGGNDLNAFAIRNLVYFGRSKDGVLENEFAGNLVEVCPTGVFTDKTLKQHYTRKWDLTMAPSVCVHCGLGCNTTAGERYGLLRRILNRYHSEINGYFLCDRGRYGYEFVNSERRIRQPLLRRAGQAEAISKSAAIDHCADLFSKNGRVIGIGSPRASLESNFALRTLVGPERFFMGMSDRESKLVAAMLRLLREGPAGIPSLQGVERSDAVLILGEDITNVAPRVALSLRQAVRQQPLRAAEKVRIPLFLDHPVRELLQDSKGPFFVATCGATRLDDVATATYRAAPDDLARLGFAVAHELDSNAPAAPDLSEDMRTLATRIAQALREARRPLVVSGPSCGSEPVIEAAANVARALHSVGRPANLSFIMPECNSLGLALIGGESLGAAFQAVQDGAADKVFILENDLYRRAPAEVVDRFLGKASHVVALDSLITPTTVKAEMVLPVGTFAEADGTLVNNEGRAQRSFAVFPPSGEIQDSWRWLWDVMVTAGRSEASQWQDLDDVWATLAATLPAVAPAREAAPPATFRMAGARIPRAPHRWSGRTAVLADINVSEPKPPEDPDTPLSFTMEGYPKQAPASLTSFFWSGGWNSIRATLKYLEEVNGPQRGGDSGVRLLDASERKNGSYFTGVPAVFQPRSGEWLLVPLHHIFGSEELSRSAPSIMELAPQPYLALNPDDASQLQVQAGKEISLELAGLECRLSVRLRPELPRGIAGLPVGVPSLEGLFLPAWGKLSAAL